MAGLIARLLSPALQRLETDKEKLANKCDLLEAERDDLRTENKSLKDRLDAETLANREHEALLINSVLQAAGAPGVPTREALKQTTEPLPDPPEEADIVNQILMDRAIEYAESLQNGGKPSQEDIDKVFAQMKLNPDYYSSN